MTAELVGVFGTIQSKYFTVGSRSPVIQVNVRPPSRDKRSSVSHNDISISGRTDRHSTLYTCPGTKTSPARGVMRRAIYCRPLAQGLAVTVPDGCKTKININANNRVMNRRAFMMVLHALYDELSRFDSITLLQGTNRRLPRTPICNRVRKVADGSHRGMPYPKIGVSPSYKCNGAAARSACHRTPKKRAFIMGVRRQSEAAMALWDAVPRRQTQSLLKRTVNTYVIPDLPKAVSKPLLIQITRTEVSPRPQIQGKRRYSCCKDAVAANPIPPPSALDLSFY